MANDPTPLIDAIEAKVVELRRLLGQLVARAAIPATPDGWPNRASGASPDSGRPWRARDESLSDDEFPPPPQGDPTGEAVLGRDRHQPDPLARQVRRLRSTCRKLSDDLDRAVTSTRHVLDLPAEDVDTGEWCGSCIRVGEFTPRHRGNLCRFCYDFVRFHRIKHPTLMVPPLAIMTVKHATGRLNTRDVDAALRKVR